MPVLALDVDTLELDADIAKAAGKTASETYRSRKPYPYGGFDDFLPAEILDRVHAELQALPEAETRLLALHGDAPRVIIEQEQEQDCDLIVVGKRGQHFVEELLLGSTTTHVLTEAQGDVLVAVAD